MKTGLFITLYGPAKTGKSLCSGVAGACGIFMSQPGGLLPLKSFLGLDIDPSRISFPTTVEDASKIIVNGAGKHPTIVMDDFSILVDQTINQLEQTHSFGDMWRALRHQVLGMRDAARSATQKGTHVIFNCHESPPKTSSGKYVRGGPALPGQLPEQFSGMSDVVDRVVYDETAAPWKFVLNTVANAEYIGGDRLSVFPSRAPMNIAEAMRASGYEIPRPKGLEWQEKIVENLAQMVLGNGIESWREVLKKASLSLQKKHSPIQVRWVLQDSLHRAVIRNAKENIIDEMFIENDEGW